jgi:hypothetical protein
MALTTFNNSLVVSQSEFKAGKYTDLNTIYQWYRRDSFTNYKGMLALWNQRRLVNTPLLNMTELKNNVVYVNGPDGQFSYSVPYEIALPVVVENLMSGVAQPGIDGQKFKIKLNDNCFTNTDRITYDFRDGVELYITEDQIYEDNGGYVYTVVVVSFDRKNAYFPPEYLKPGTQFMKISNSNGEYDTLKSSISNKFGSLKLTNQLGGGRSVYHWITAYADMLTCVDSSLANISSLYGDPGQKNYSMVMYNLDENGKPIKGSLRWMAMVEAMLWAEMKKMEELDLMWSKGGIIEGSGRTPVRVGMGLYEQMRNGNRVKYTTLTKALLDGVFGQLFYNSGIPVEKRSVKVQCGSAALIEISKLIENEYGKVPFMTDAKAVGLLKGDRMNLNFGYRFTSMEFPTAGHVEFEHNPAFDNTYNRAADGLMGEFPLSSYTMAIFDVTDERQTNAAMKMDTQFKLEDGFNTGANVCLVKPQGADGIVWGYELGTHSPSWMNKGPIYSTSQRDGYAIWMKSMSSIWLKDASRTVLLEKNRS